MQSTTYNDNKQVIKKTLKLQKILDEKNNVLSTQNYDLEIAKDPLWLYFLITRFI